MIDEYVKLYHSLGEQVAVGKNVASFWLLALA